jgi:integrase
MMPLRDGVTKRGSTWSYVIRVYDPETGLSKPRWVGGFASEKAAKAARDEARVKARAGQYIDRNRITVGSYLDQWLAAHAMEIKPKTLQDYRHLIERHVKPQIGDLPLQAIRPARITKLYRDLATTGGRDGAGLSPRTVEYVHAILRKALRDAVVVDQVLASNPAERAKRPRGARRELGEVWTPDQLRIFLQTARGHRLSALYHLAAYTGARRGELLYLRWDHIDLDAAEIRITGSTAVIDGQRTEGTTKGGRSRTVSIDPGTVQVLKEHRTRQATERLTAGPERRGRANGYVFTTALGEPVYPDTVSRLMLVLIKRYNARQSRLKAGRPIPVARLHDLRHVHATTLLRAGVPVHVVAARLGHADPSVTLRVYAHVISEQLAEAAVIFADAVGSD